MNAKKKKELMIEIENIIGNSCYNGNIKNLGPNYVRYCDGREFRYPITFIDEDAKKEKCWSTDQSMPLNRVKTGYYAFGANQLHIMEAIEKVINFLEENHRLR